MHSSLAWPEMPTALGRRLGTGMAEGLDTMSNSSAASLHRSGMVPARLQALDPQGTPRPFHPPEILRSALLRAAMGGPGRQAHPERTKDQ